MSAKNDPDRSGNTEPIDLSFCEREPIHIPGAIQSHGCLIACSMPNWAIVAVSANSRDFLGLDPASVFDQPLEAVLPGKTVHDLRNVLQSAMVSGAAERLVGVPISESGSLHDLTLHVAKALAIIEIVPRLGTDKPGTDPVILVKSMIARLKRASSLDRFLSLAAGQIRAVTGFDRVMVYRFLEDASGEVVAEALRSGLAPFLGLRFPASDIPAQARALYKRQWLRLIPDIDYRPVPLLKLPSAPDEIDLSLASLRSVSPVHLEYLRNMGSRATLTLSLMQGDELWGLVACHHDSPRRVSSSVCAAAELFGQIFSLQIEAKEQALAVGEASRAREAHLRLMSSMPPEETLFENLEPFSDALREIISCDGVGACSDRGFAGVGLTPPQPVVEGLLEILGRRSGTEPFATDSLVSVLPAALSGSTEVSGVLALPFSSGTKECLLFFRSEAVRTVTWGGDPNKPVEPGGAGHRIGPRKSFEAWREVVRGKSRPWTAGELQAAEALRVALLEVIIRRSDVISRERQAAQESQAFLIAELNHRVKNILALIRSLVRQTRHGTRSINDFADDLERRVHALAKAHDQLNVAGWKNTPLRRLLEAEVRAWTNEPNRICFEGPPVTLESRAFQALALVFHELVTNAAKHGCLSRSGGSLSVAWSKDGDGTLRIEWRETGGPSVTAPQRRGFGSVVITQVIPFELGGTVALDYRAEGLCAVLTIPAVHVGEEEKEDVDGTAEPDHRHEISFERLLLVEDSMMIALDAQAMLGETGLQVEVAGTVDEGFRLLGRGGFDAAVLDINLAGETSFGLADELTRRGLPFVFATGYGESVVVPERFKAAPIVSKPYDQSSLSTALGAATPEHQTETRP